MTRLAGTIHRGTPFPVILVFHISKQEFSCAHHKYIFGLVIKRFSEVKKGTLVAEDFQITGWFDLSDPTQNRTTFFERLYISA